MTVRLPARAGRAWAEPLQSTAWFMCAGRQDAYRGGDGPLGVGGGNNMAGNPLYQAFIDAGVEAGYPRTEDYNGFRQEGFGPMHMTVEGGIRSSTSRAYLDPIKKRTNLSVFTNTMVDRLLFEGKRVCGFIGRRGNADGETIELKVSREMILSAGSIGSPMILQRSGIGGAGTLSNAGIRAVHILDGVGQNLQDHLEVYFQYYCKQPVSLNAKLDPLSKFLIGARWFFFKTGLGATNHFESCAFIRSKPGLKAPDIQYHFLPAAMRYDGTASIKGHGFQVHVGPNKPKARGQVSIQSAEMDAPPRQAMTRLMRGSVKMSKALIIRAGHAGWEQLMRRPVLSIPNAASSGLRGCAWLMRPFSRP